MRGLGYIEGQTIRLEFRWADRKVEALPDLAADLVRLKVDVLYTSGPQALRAAKSASRTVPIVADDLENDPVESGFVASIARPGGNITGLSVLNSELTAKKALLSDVVASQL